MSGGGGAVVAIMAAKKQQELLERFSRAGATGPQSAKPLVDVGVDPDDRVVKTFMKGGVIRDAGAGRYYFDHQAFVAHRRSRAQFVLLLAVILFAALAIMGMLLKR